jgi:hypothetical protein
VGLAGRTKIFFSRFSNDGRTFSRPIALSDDSDVQGCDIAVEADGDVAQGTDPRETRQDGFDGLMCVVITDGQARPQHVSQRRRLRPEHLRHRLLTDAAATRRLTAPAVSLVRASRPCKTAVTSARVRARQRPAACEDGPTPKVGNGHDAHRHGR